MLKRKPRPKPCLILSALLFVVFLVGCDKPYLPAKFAQELDFRIVELKAAKQFGSPCDEFLSADLDYLLELRAASK